MNHYYEGFSRSRATDVARKVDSALIVEIYEPRPHHRNLASRMGAGLVSLGRYVLRTDEAGRHFRTAA